MVRIKTLLHALSYGAALLGFLPLFPYLELPARIAFPAAFVLGVYGDRVGRHLLKPAFATVLTVAAFVFYTAQIAPHRLVEPAVNLLAMTLGVRLLGPKGGREHLQVFLLALFALAASSLLDLSIVFLAFLVPTVLIASAGLLLLAFHAADPDAALSRREVRGVGEAALVLPALSLVLMVAFFLILPRARHPLWPFFQTPAAASGLNDRVVPGALGASSDGGPPVFRVETPRLAPEDLYWRGIVLARIEGEAWLRASAPGERTQVRGGKGIRQVFYPESRPDGLLPTLDLPVAVTGIGHRRGEDLVFASQQGGRRMKYEVHSRVGGRLEVVGEVDRALYLDVPSPVSERVAQAADFVATAGGGDREKINRLEAFFLARGLTYAIEGSAGGSDPVDDFLFGRRRGWCEHFAASFALMLRLSGVPARLVGGYHGGEYNELGGYYLVTEDAAHLWVEALVDGREWVRLDPTRLARDVVSHPAPRFGAGRHLLDAIDYFWNRMVIGYDLERQMGVFRQAGAWMGEWRPDFSSLLWMSAGAAGAVGMMAGVRRMRGRESREKRLLRRYLRRVQRRHETGEIPPAWGLGTLARHVDDPACREFAEIYGGAIYRDRPLSAEEYRRLLQLMGEIGRYRQSG